MQARNVRKPSVRLKETILKADLTTPLSLLMAQQRDCIIYREAVNMEHIKLTGKVYDQVPRRQIVSQSFKANLLVMFFFRVIFYHV